MNVPFDLVYTHWLIKQFTPLDVDIIYLVVLAFFNINMRVCSKPPLDSFENIIGTGYDVCFEYSNMIYEYHEYKNYFRHDDEVVIHYKKKRIKWITFYYHQSIDNSDTDFSVELKSRANR